MPRLEALPHGCYVFRGWLDAAQQREVTAAVLAAADGVRGDWCARAADFQHPQIICSYDREPGKRARDCERACGLRACTGACGRPTCPSEPSELYRCAADACRRARAGGGGHNDGEVLPASVAFDPNSVWALLYKGGDVMPSHLDRAEGWTMSVSVGASVEFVVGAEPEKGSMYADYAPHKPHPGQEARRLVIESGDLLLFEGDRLFHGVEGTSEGTAPDWWADGTVRPETRQFARLGLLLRDGR